MMAGHAALWHGVTIREESWQPCWLDPCSDPERAEGTGYRRRERGIPMETEAAALVVDARGLACPMPIFKAKQGLKSVEVGQVVEVLCTDPGSLADFTAFAHATGHELLAAQSQDAIYRFVLRRTT